MSDLNTGGSEYGLATLDKEGTPPESRMRDASHCQDFARRLSDQDQKRSWKRSKLYGLVAGFPPYQRAKLLAAGRGDACNANFQTANSYMESGAGAFYDLAAEAPGFIGIRTSYGTEEQKEVFSRILSSEADRILSGDKLWDWEMQRSQWNMVLYGHGPLIWEDGFRVLPRSINAGDFLVPERTRSDVQWFDAAVARVDFYPPQLYDFIKNPEAAACAGWNVEFTQKVIANAMRITQPEARSYNWEFFAEQLKANSLDYYDDSLICRLCVVWWKEFDGTITEAIVQTESTTPKGVKYLFFHQGRYSNFSQCIAPMYFDRGNNGFHYDVSGLGTKMYSAMEFENRLFCGLMDGAFSPKILFKPTTTETTQRMQMARLGAWGVLPPGWEAIQTPIQGFLDEGLAMFRASSDLMRSNLSSYRQHVPAQQSGNPPTKYQKQMEAAQQGALSKTTFNRYYKQLDILYGEIVRRLCNLNSTDDRAVQFQKRCQEQGVPPEALGRLESVEAIRVVGEGSAFLRKAALNDMMPVVGRLPEDGQNSWLNDFVAATCGQRSVERYNPAKSVSRLPGDQQFTALEGVSLMKNNIPPIVTSSQNALTFAATYLNAGVQSLQSVQKGADPLQVMNFLKLCGPAIAAHLKRIGQDPLRAQAAKAIQGQWKQLARATDQLGKQVAAMQKQRQAGQKKQQEILNDIQLKNVQTKAAIQDKTMKTRAQLALQAVKARHNMNLSDATTASEIHRKNQQAKAAAPEE